MRGQGNTPGEVDKSCSQNSCFNDNVSKTKRNCPRIITSKQVGYLHERAWKHPRTGLSRAVLLHCSAGQWCPSFYFVILPLSDIWCPCVDILRQILAPAPLHLLRFLRRHTFRFYHTFWIMSGFLVFICTFMNYVRLASKISWWNQRNRNKKDQYGHIRKNLDLNIGPFEFCGEKMGSNQTFLGMERGDCMKGGPKKPVSYQQWQLYVEVDF